MLENTDLLPSAKSFEIISDKSGYITKMDAEKIGSLSVSLGAGRIKKDDAIDFGAGFVLLKKTGDKIEKGEVICTAFTNREVSKEEITSAYLGAVKIEEKAAEKLPLIYKIIK